MKNIKFFLLISLFVGAGFISCSSAVFAADQKMGYVDLRHVFDDYQKTKDFDKTLEAKGNSKQAERDKMVAEIKKMRDEGELLSAKAKDEKLAAVDEKIKALQEYDRITRDDLRKERDSMVQDILKEIDTTIKAYGKSEGYTFIFNDQALVYKGDGGDLTAQVLKALNDSYSKKK